MIYNKMREDSINAPNAPHELNGEELFNIVRESYAMANAEYIKKQIKIASEYLSSDQKKKLKEKVY